MYLCIYIKKDSNNQYVKAFNKHLFIMRIPWSEINFSKNTMTKPPNLLHINKMRKNLRSNTDKIGLRVNTGYRYNTR